MKIDMLVRRVPIERTIMRSVLTYGVFGALFVGLASGFSYSILYQKNWLLGILVLVYFFLQLIFAGTNYRSCRNLLTQNHPMDRKTWEKESCFDEEYFREHPCSVGILVVGYREDPVYWRLCVESIKRHSPPSIVRVVCASVDGNEEDDERMVRQFEEVWGEEEKTEIGMTSVPLVDPPIQTATLLLPHRGKRHTMRSGFEYLRRNHPDLDYIIVMDSDSVITPNAVWSIVRVMNENPANGCGTGCLNILERTNMLTRIIDARYSYAFNIERSAMSTMGSMNCCSGPFSIYRMSCLDDELLGAFVQQRMCFQPVGPGDDRHLTNLIMAKGYRSIQCPYSIAYTECPTTMERFLVQQLRWMRSFYREQPYQMYALPVQSWYLMVTTIYEILFPYIVVMSMIPTFGILYPTPASIFRDRVLLCVGIIFIRTIILMAVMMRWSVWYNLFMLPLYFIALLPMKIYALLTLGIQNWMTSNRMFLHRICNVDVFCMYGAIVAWNAGYVYLMMRRFGII